MPFSSYIDNKLIDHLLGAGTYSKPSTVYVALFNGNPASGGTEISTSGTAYTRKSSAFTITGNAAANTADIEWSIATAPWGNITYCAIYDASTGGNMLVYAPLVSPKTIDTGDVLRILATTLIVTLT